MQFVRETMNKDARPIRKEEIEGMLERVVKFFMQAFGSLKTIPSISEVKQIFQNGWQKSWREKSSKAATIK